MAVSPTAEGFRAAFRWPVLTLGEIAWRWGVGATGTAVFFFGLFEYLNTLPVTNGEMLFLRTRQPYLVAQAIAHILRGSLSRGVISAMLAALMLVFLWILAASIGRIATVRAMLEYFRERGLSGESGAAGSEREVASSVSTLQALVRLNFLRVATALAAILGFVGATILAGFASPDAHPRPGVAFLLFLPMAGLICLLWCGLNWLLTMAGMFAVRNGEDVVGSISDAVALCRERTGAVLAVSTWTGLAHLVAFVGATTVISIPMGLVPLVPWRFIVLVMILVTLAYFALADWLYTARLAGYVCITEMPLPVVALAASFESPPTTTLTTIDRDEPILSDPSRNFVET